MSHSMTIEIAFVWFSQTCGGGAAAGGASSHRYAL